MIQCISFCTLFLCSCSDKSDDNGFTTDSQRLIKFSGYNCEVASSGESKQGPGPNYFSDSDKNVWVDRLGRLHLKISYHNGKWNCAKVALEKSFGFNKSSEAQYDVQPSYVYCNKSRYSLNL